MKKSSLIILLLSISLLSSCSSPKMALDSSQRENLSPVGVFICSSLQGLDNGDTTHRDFVIETASKKFKALSENKYSIVDLNSIIPHDEVFKKPFGSFYIDDKKIGEYARSQKCKSYLIVYYAETEMEYAIGSVYLKDKPFTASDGTTMHKKCSLYGWLVDANTNKIIKRSHTALNSFQNSVEQKNKVLTKEDYTQFLSKITANMFDEL